MRLCKNKPCRNTINKDAPKFVRWCSDECGTTLALAALEKKKAQAARAQAKAQKAEKKARTEKVRNFRMKDRSHQLELTQKAVNKLVKLLDKDVPCIVHGRYNCADGQWDAGHFLTRAAHPELRFDLRNIFKQCRGSNVAVQWRGRGKNTEASIRQQFQLGIVQRFGYRHLEWLQGPHEVAKWAMEDIEALRLEALAEIRLIESGQPPSRNWRALPTEQP